MIYDDRNRNNLNKLADHTKIAAYKWYQYCIDNQIQILIYETIRTKEKQAENVAKGASKTMMSYHLVGQALDFVPVNSKGEATWSINSYIRKDVMSAINYAKSLGFTWGGDWDNDGEWRDETFLDSPHLQYNYKGYATDSFNKVKVNGDELTLSQYKELLSKINELNNEIVLLKSNVNNKADLYSTSSVGESHTESSKWAIENELTNGDNPTAALTRQQAFTMFKRFYDKFIK
nr:M15 family metallopeptidase [Ureibacillus xyleni]